MDKETLKAKKTIDTLIEYAQMVKEYAQMVKVLKAKDMWYVMCRDIGNNKPSTIQIRKWVEGKYKKKKID